MAADPTIPQARTQLATKLAAKGTASMSVTRSLGRTLLKACDIALTVPPPPPVLPPVTPGPAVLTFSDEFDGPTLSPIWSMVYGLGGLNDLMLNDELQRFDPAGVVLPGDGMLHLVATPWPDAPFGGKYRSGMIQSRGHPVYGADEKWTWTHPFSQRYGYFEMRAEPPTEPGSWPAFWLVDENGFWPPEIDIMEMVGSDPGGVVTTIHTRDLAAAPWGQIGKTAAHIGPGFHTFGVNWQADKIDWYLDRVKVWTAPTPSDMHTPMSIIVDNAVGGNWAGAVDMGADAKMELVVDYIKAWDRLPFWLPS